MDKQTQFDLFLAEMAKDDGMNLAADRRTLLLQVAREAALRLAKLRTDNRITIDDVQRDLVRQGAHPSDLGNAAGSVFRGKQWRFTGDWAISERVSNNGRAIRVWRLAE